MKSALINTLLLIRRLLSFIYKKNRNGNLIKVLIIKKVYIVKDFKAKILIKINIIRPKKINILISFKELSVKSYKITLLVKITPKEYIIKRVIYIRKSIIILARF